MHGIQDAKSLSMITRSYGQAVLVAMSKAVDTTADIMSVQSITKSIVAWYRETCSQGLIGDVLVALFGGVGFPV